MKKLRSLLLLVGFLPFLTGAQVVIKGPLSHGSASCLGNVYTLTTGGASTWDPPCSGNVKIEAYGAGGSGGGWTASGNGGGGGAYCVRNTKALTPGSALSYSIGAKGSAVATNSLGIAAGATTIDSMTCNGGAGGGAGGPGAGGTGSGGDTNTSGSVGGGWSGNNGGGGGNCGDGVSLGGAAGTGPGNPGGNPCAGSAAGGNSNGSSGDGGYGQIKITYL